MWWLSNLCAWSPTIVLLLMFKRLLPRTTIRDFYPNAFSGRLHPGLLLLLAVAIVGGMAASAFLAGLLHSAQGKAFTPLFSLGD